MNEMYDMSIVTHNIGVMGLLGVIIVNILILLVSQDIRMYAKRMRIFMPIGAGMLSLIIFTGAVMMTAKHLEFTIANSIMTVFSFILIFLEVKRYVSLKHLDLNKIDAFKLYRQKAFRIFQIEFFVSLAISVWMLA
jgi:hypothetical protein